MKSYIELIARSRDMDKIATYIRAFATYHVATTSNVIPFEEGIRIIKDANEQAQMISQCRNLSQAKKLLREWNFIPQKKPAKVMPAHEIARREAKRKAKNEQNQKN